ncbi:hypothetical protein DFJ73DRAFT_2180 [Zopfochytrium polystomum]|nr:hypothetical protein DFJ73DRAFT_2180 [Zopfochytrium polystomum]
MAEPNRLAAFGVRLANLLSTRFGYFYNRNNASDPYQTATKVTKVPLSGLVKHGLNHLRTLPWLPIATAAVAAALVVLLLLVLRPLRARARRLAGNDAVVTLNASDDATTLHARLADNLPRQKPPGATASTTVSRKNRKVVDVYTDCSGEQEYQPPSVTCQVPPPSIVPIFAANDATINFPNSI